MIRICEPNCHSKYISAGRSYSHANKTQNFIVCCYNTCVHKTFLNEDAQNGHEDHLQQRESADGPYGHSTPLRARYFEASKGRSQTDKTHRDGSSTYEAVEDSQNRHCKRENVEALAWSYRVGRQEGVVHLARWGWVSSQRE